MSQDIISPRSTFFMVWIPPTHTDYLLLRWITFTQDELFTHLLPKINDIPTLSWWKLLGNTLLPSSWKDGIFFLSHSPHSIFRNTAMGITVKSGCIWINLNVDLQREVTVKWETTTRSVCRWCHIFQLLERKRFSLVRFFRMTKLQSFSCHAFQEWNSASFFN